MNPDQLKIPGPGKLNNSGCNLLREARTKAQESYLAGVVYSTCRVNLSRYPGAGRYNMLPCPADSLTKGGLLLSCQQSARWGNVACGVTCRGYYVGVIMGEAEKSYPSVWAD